MIPPIDPTPPNRAEVAGELDALLALAGCPLKLRHAAADDPLALLALTRDYPIAEGNLAQIRAWLGIRASTDKRYVRVEITNVAGKVYGWATVQVTDTLTDAAREAVDLAIRSVRED